MLNFPDFHSGNISSIASMFEDDGILCLKLYDQGQNFLKGYLFRTSLQVLATFIRQIAWDSLPVKFFKPAYHFFKANRLQESDSSTLSRIKQEDISVDKIREYFSTVNNGSHINAHYKDRSKIIGPVIAADSFDVGNIIISTMPTDIRGNAYRMVITDKAWVILFDNNSNNPIYDIFRCDLYTYIEKALKAVNSKDWLGNLEIRNKISRTLFEYILENSLKHPEQFHRPAC